MTTPAAARLGATDTVDGSELLLERLARSQPGPELTVIVPTRNERDNIIPLYRRLDSILAGLRWEMMVVDDDSADGTSDVVRWLAQHDRRVRLLSRLGRRGLASACIEGALASTAPYVAVIDGDLQHDEALLPRMLDLLKKEPLDIIVGSRYVDDGGVGAWDERRVRLSSIATQLSQRVLGVPVADPMSGFFMVTREALDGAVRQLSALGFKILIDLFASSPEPLRVRELPYEFRARHTGESKFDARIGIEYLMLLADKTVGRIIPVRFLTFAAVGAIGVLAHMAVLWTVLSLSLPFGVAQALATGVAMVGNFTLNNAVTYHDRRLTGWKFLYGLISFSLICSVGAVANVGIATMLFTGHTSWWLAGLAGVAMSAVWNYAVSATLTWRGAR